jgi:group I intron endonuclease
MESGIYKIECIINNKIYIGSSNNIHRRKIEHMSSLKRNKHFNKYIQRSWNKYGEENFMFEILENCEVEKLIEREQYYIDTLKPELNTVLSAKPRRNIKLSEEELHRIKTMNIGRKHVGKALDNIRKAAQIRKANKISEKGGYKGSKKPIYLIDKNNNILKEYDGIRVASRDLNLDSSAVVAVLKGKIKQIKGYIFKYKF